MEQFRERHSIRRVPIQATNAYIELAKEIYPKASEHTIHERIRLRKKTIFLGGLSYLEKKKQKRGISPSYLDGR